MELHEARAFARLVLELDAAKAKHPDFPGDTKSTLALLAEEHLELVRAVNDGDGAQRISEEALHVAVVAIRIVEKIYSIFPEVTL